MGSSCSSARSCNDTGNFSKQCKMDSSPCRRSECKKSQVIVVEATNDKPSTTSQEQHSTSEAGPSFAWLVSTPVVRNATDRQGKSIRINPMEGKETKSIMKYRSGKYVKSWQHPAQLRNSNNANSRQLNNASPSPSDCSQYPNSATRDGTEHEANKKNQAKQLKVTFSKSCS